MRIVAFHHRAGRHRPDPHAPALPPSHRLSGSRSGPGFSGVRIAPAVRRFCVTGTVAGTMVIDYRILVAGPCGAPVGTFDEHWIAHGTFTGAIGSLPAAGSFSYVAHVKAGGHVNGRVVFGQGLAGELTVQGDFGDGHLSYRGWTQ